MSGLQIARGASQAMFIVSERRLSSRSARKNELLFCNSRETGEQDWKVALLRKAPKKSGQLWEVKLLPRDVSKGTGRGVVMTVAPAVVAAIVVELADSDAIDTAEVEGGDDMSVEEGDEPSALEVVLLSSCRL